METLGPFKGIYRVYYWGYIGVMEKKMETLGPFKGIYRVILGLYGDNGKENGNYYKGLYRVGYLTTMWCFP